MNLHHLNDILSRGTKLLDFMESHWKIDLGDEAFKHGLLHLQFLGIKTNE